MKKNIVSKKIYNTVLNNIDIIFFHYNNPLLNDKKLHSATNFLQYNFFNKKLITIISELHSTVYENVKDSKIQISVTDYAKSVIDRNNKSRILIEIDDKIDPSTTSSINIKDIAIMVNGENKLSHLIKFDFRIWYLTRHNNHMLYGTIFSQMNKDFLLDNFIKPYYEKHNEAFRIKDTTEDTMEFLFKYIDTLNKDFKVVQTYIENIENLENHLQHIQKLLKDCWMKVCDFYILREIMKNDDINEYVILIGQSHIENIKNVFSSNNKIFEKLNEKNVSNENNESKEDETEYPLFNTLQL